MKHCRSSTSLVFALALAAATSGPLAGADAVALSSPESAPPARGPYFGQPLPGETPAAFNPAFLSQRYGFVARIAFSPDGNECFFTVTDATFSHPQILHTRREGDIWTTPVVTPFTQTHVKSNEPFFSSDGNQLYFSSDEDGKSPTNKRDIWMVERTPEGWGHLQRLPPPLNSEYAEFFFSQTADGARHFVSNRPGGLGGFDMYRMRSTPDQPMKVENLGAPLNSPDDEWDPCLGPNSSFLVFCSTRPGGHGNTDLYVAFPDDHGGWTPPVNLGEGFSSPADEYAPSLSPDGRFLFFTRHDGKRGELYWFGVSGLERFRTQPRQDAVSATPAKVTGPYFGQPAPGRAPQIFAPGILSLPDRMEARIAFSPDGNECFFTVPSDLTFSSVQLYCTKRINDVWTLQQLAPFARPGHSYLQPFFSADGNTLYFTSNQNGPYDIWSVGRTAQGWGQPQILPTPPNGSDYQAEYSQTTDGTAYVESTRPGGNGKVGLWRIRPPLPSQPSVAEHLGGSMDSGTWDSDPYVSPDGKQLFFSSGRPGGCGGADLYVTTPDGAGGWTVPVNLNVYCPGTNTGANEYGPSLSPNGRDLFFVRFNPQAKQCDVWWVANPFDPSKAK